VLLPFADGRCALLIDPAGARESSEARILALPPWPKGSEWEFERLGRSRTLGRSATPRPNTGIGTSARSVTEALTSTGVGAGRSPSFRGFRTRAPVAFSNLGVALAMTRHDSRVPGSM